MFSSRICRGKAFASEQKIRELKKLSFKTKSMDKKLGQRIRPNKLIEKAKRNLKKMKSVKYGFSREKIGLKSVESDQFRKKFHKQQKIKKENDRRSKKRDINLKRKIRDALNIEELVNFLAQRLKKKDAPERLYKIHKTL